MRRAPSHIEKMILRIASLAVLAVVLAACGTPTPYVPAGTDGYGYSVQQIEDGRFRVSFSGNSLTSRHVVANYLLYRAAEVTLAQGGDYFVVVNRSIDADTTYHTTYDAWPYYGPYRYRDPFWGPGFGPGRWDGTSRPVTRYQAYAEILVRSGPKPSDDHRAFAAREVVHNLAPTVVHPTELSAG